MDASEILVRYAAGERDFCGVELGNAGLSNVDLSYANLSNANLSNADLSYTNLSNADLSNANLSNANLRKANLWKANLRKAYLSEANLSGATLTSTYLSTAYLRNANLNNSVSVYIVLKNGNLSNADLRKADLRKADLSGVNLIDANLSGANLIYANLSKANLSKANLSEANLSEANLNGANLISANLNKANLIAASLFEADLTDANLEGAKLDGTILAYKKVSQELQRENQELRNRIDFFETQSENLIERQVQKRLVTNQGITAKKSLTWNRLRFRSEAERKIAEVLDEMGVMYFPNASGRVMSEDGMETREVDFLICSRGKWGILECDGELWHFLKKGKLPSAANDHKRDNDFNRHGQWFIKRFTAEECKKNSHKVIRQFLDMLHKFHEDQRYLITGDSAETESLLPPINLSIQSEGSSFQSNATLPELTTHIIDDEAVNVFSEGTVVLDNAEILKRLEALKDDEDEDIPF